MSACEHCWGLARSRSYHSGGTTADEYYIQMERAERENAPCTQNTLEGARLRAGQWWDEATQRDKRTDAALDRTTKEGK